MTNDDEIDAERLRRHSKRAKQDAEIERLRRKRLEHRAGTTEIDQLRRERSAHRADPDAHHPSSERHIVASIPAFRAERFDRTTAHHNTREEQRAADRADIDRQLRETRPHNEPPHNAN